MQLSFKVKNYKSYKDIAARQVPFVLARMNSKLAADITFKIREQIPQNFQGKYRFVQSGMLYERGTKQDPKAKVLNRDTHMWTHEAGQVVEQSSRGRRLLVTSKHYRRYNKKDKASDLMARPEFFRNDQGFFERKEKDQVTPYLWYSDKNVYQDRLMAKETADEHVRENAQEIFVDYLSEAVSKAR